MNDGRQLLGSYLEGIKYSPNPMLNLFSSFVYSKLCPGHPNDSSSFAQHVNKLNESVDYGQVQTKLVKDSKGDVERLPHSGNAFLYLATGNAPYHCPPDVSVKLEQSFAQISGRIQNAVGPPYCGLVMSRSCKENP